MKQLRERQSHRTVSLLYNKVKGTSGRLKKQQVEQGLDATGFELSQAHFDQFWHMLDPTGTGEVSLYHLEQALCDEGGLAHNKYLGEDREIEQPSHSTDGLAGVVDEEMTVDALHYALASDVYRRGLAHELKKFNTAAARINSKQFSRFVARSHPAASMEVAEELFDKLSITQTPQSKQSIEVGLLCKRIRQATQSDETTTPHQLKQTPRSFAKGATMRSKHKACFTTPSGTALPEASVPEAWSQQGYDIGRGYHFDGYSVRGGIVRGRMVHTPRTTPTTHLQGDANDPLDSTYASEAERFRHAPPPGPRDAMRSYTHNQRCRQRVESNMKRIEQYVQRCNLSDEKLAPDRAGTEQQDERCRWLVQQKIGWLSALSVRGDDARVTDFFVNVDLI